ncbi:FtsW/RodA/SpoVE family cell cycle protein [Streptacidiphilus fuscans]|uniref:FtsW/RodA/SpoVE family cell cycle protein n=1 Tax=Streptacidiphilus fuscans TaxID=2789292 RepID=A0A931FAD5_9ACTN|nr:FtsW/RodA/SpoVE family cell cycle protein [Streptacidiphilus fuscans]MBF9067532.1 FtsW/RodA/SpoVE family cell cycle protein [Streptacidiphilus fuscans]
MGARSSRSAAVAPGANRKRNLELMLLLFAVAVCAFADASAELGMHGSIPSGFALDVCAPAVLALLAHLVVRKWAPYADPVILPVSVLLTGIGLTLIHRLDISYAQVDGWKPSAPNQLMWTVIAIVVFAAIIIGIKHHRVLARYTYLLMASALILLVAPAFFGADVYGARRWVSIGPLQFQPGEFSKIIIIIFFASYLMANRDALALVGRRFMGIALPRGRNMGPILVVWAVSLVVLVFESDLGTSLIFFGAFIIMLYVATERTGWVVLGGLMAVGGAVAAGTLVSHVTYRVHNWLDPFAAYNPTPPQGSSPQLAESLFSMANGGLLGTGLGKGDSWLIGFAGNSDWIFSTVGEELGTAGVMVVLVLYMLLTQRGMRVAVRLSDPFGKLLASGLSAAFILQVFVVVGGVIGLIPQTGKALPFLAQGGSAMVAAWITVALLIKLSDAAGRAELEPKPAPDETLTISAAEIAAARAEMEQAG